MKNRLKELRKEKHLTRKQVSHELSISRRLLRKLENRTKRMTIAQIDMFCDFYEVDSCYLLGSCNIRNFNKFYNLPDDKEILNKIYAKIDERRGN